MTPDEVWIIIQSENPDIMKKDTMMKICRSLAKRSSGEVNSWISLPNNHTNKGRPKKFIPTLSNALLQFARKNHLCSLEKIRDDLLDQIFGDLNEWSVGISTVDKELHQRGWTRKVIAILHIINYSYLFIPLSIYYI